ncbi:RNA-binding domain-containing protein [Trametes sanguinea]|nr:RNA-binding domain-containing protein [Trametes sanguinea]
MFIGGLNWDTTDESLRKYFSQFGKVEACTIMRDAAGRSRCFAFLTFEDPASVNAVMVREHFLDGKIIDPKRAIPRQEHQRATKLFIGGLPGSVTSESMREYFSQFGKVVDATVMLDRETGRSKGFGFVSFENVDVTPMLGFGNLQIDGKLIDVKLAQPRSQREGFAEQNGGGGGGGRGSYGTTSAYGTQNFAGASGGAAATGQGGANAPFDPQALAQLYTRMISQIGGMNPMMGAMNPAMMGGQYGAGGMGAGGAAGGMGMRGMGGGPMGGMGMGGGMGGGAGMGVGRGGPGMGGPGGAGMGMQNGPGSLGPNVPRGPRNAAPPTGPSGGVGPQRAGQRGQHSYHPYAR